MPRRQNVIIKLSLTRAEMLEFRKYVWRFRQEMKAKLQRLKVERAIAEQKAKHLAWEGKYILGRALANAGDRTEAEVERIATAYANEQMGVTE